jgi:hypothetical protein
MVSGQCFFVLILLTRIFETIDFLSLLFVDRNADVVPLQQFKESAHRG